MSDFVLKTENHWYLIHNDEISEISEAVANCYKMKTSRRIHPIGVLYTARIQSFHNQSEEAGPPIVEIQDVHECKCACDCGACYSCTYK